MARALADDRRSVVSMGTVKVDVAPGELIDKITILLIKSERMDDPDKIANVQLELDILQAIHESSIPGSLTLDNLTAKLKRVNEALWEIEDDIRACEAERDFGDTFVRLARSVYRTNDERAQLKRDINVLLGSQILEEKSYKPY